MGGIVSCMSNLMHISEQIALCTACTGLICCLMLTITMTLGMGIGIGYNYCFVDMKTKYKHIRSHYVYPGNPRLPDEGAGNVVEEPEIEEVSENDALRRPQYISEELPSMSDINMSPNTFHDKPRSNFALARNDDIIYHHNSVLDSESFNGTGTSVNTTVDIANDVATAISETSPESSSSISASFLISLSTIASNSVSKSSSKTASINEAKTTIKFQSKQSTPESPTVKNSSSRKVKKLVIPITGLDLISLLSKLSAENRNYSLQVVTT